MKLLIFLCLTLSSIPNHYSKGNNENISLNTAVHARYLSDFEKEIIHEINRLRINPSKYATDFLLPMQKYYKHSYLHYPGDLPLITREGSSALNECIRELQKQDPLPLLYPSSGLSMAANDHVRDQSRSGKTGHYGSDRSGFKIRIERYGKWNIRIAENIAYGGISPRQVIIYLLIDDGIKDRGHRKNLLNPQFKFIGVAEGIHPTYKQMVVMDFAGAFTEN